MIPLERFQDDKIYMQTTRREVAANRLPVDEGILSSRSPPPSYSAENTGWYVQKWAIICILHRKPVTNTPKYGA